MTWLQTHTGRAVDLARPEPDQIVLEDVAWALAGLPRYAAHTTKFYSVAEHSCHVADYLEANGAEPHVVFAGLMHDSPEFATGDITYPMQLALGPAVRRLIKLIQLRLWHVAMQPALGIPANVDIEDRAVKAADCRILLDERDQHLGPPPMPWEIEQAGGKPLGITITGWPQFRAREEWLKRYGRLLVAVQVVEQFGVARG